MIITLFLRGKKTHKPLATYPTCMYHYKLRDIWNEPMFYVFDIASLLLHALKCTTPTLFDDNSLLGETMSICLCCASQACDPTIEHPYIAMLNSICLGGRRFRLFHKYANKANDNILKGEDQTIKQPPWIQ